MEDNKNTNVDTQTTTNDTQTTTAPAVDYEKLYKESVANQEKERKYAQDLKAKLQEKLTDEEKQKALAEEREARYKEIEKENKIIKIKSELSKSINDENYLDEVTSLLVDGNVTTAVSKINSYVLAQKDDYEKQLKETKLTNNPTPPASNSVGVASVTKEQFAKMNYTERASFKKDNPKKYEEYNK